MISKRGFWQNSAQASAQPDRAVEIVGGLESRPSRFSQRTTGSHVDALGMLNTYEGSGQGWFWATDASGRLTYLTAQMRLYVASDDRDLIGTVFTELFVKDGDASGAGRSLPFLFTRQSRFEKVVVRATEPRETRLWSVSAVPQFDRQGCFAGFHGNGVDITEQQKSSEHASRLARFDALTGVANRLRMSEVLESVLSGGDSSSSRCAVMMLDLDRFKQVNDTLGHPAGDELLKQVANRLLKIVNNNERVFG